MKFSQEINHLGNFSLWNEHRRCGDGLKGFILEQ
jgi:hypothetical protein